MTTQQPSFNQEQALQHYTELQRRIRVGTYEKRGPHGEFGSDGILESVDNLEALAAKHGLLFIWHQDENRWALEPMSKEEKAVYKAVTEQESE